MQLHSRSTELGEEGQNLGAGRALNQLSPPLQSLGLSRLATLGMWSGTNTAWCDGRDAIQQQKGAIPSRLCQFMEPPPQRDQRIPTFADWIAWKHAPGSSLFLPLQVVLGRRWERDIPCQHHMHGSQLCDVSLNLRATYE